MIFAVYCNAVVSIPPEQCQTVLGELKSTMLNRYRFAVEQALTRASFLTSSSLMTLQAFVFFLVCVRHEDCSRLVWSLSGLAIRLAQALGIHRDGSIVALTPFETEMQRRLWWQISIVDTRAAEDHSTDPSFSRKFFDTRLPLNINDDDISPTSKDASQGHVGTTEMTSCHIRYELCIAIRQLSFVPQANTPHHTGSATRTLEEKNRIIETCHQRIESRYLQHCDKSVSILWLCATVARLIMAKMWLMSQHLSRGISMSQWHSGPQSSDVRERFYVTSVEVVEYSHLLITDENTAKWGWLFRTYMQWRLVAFILAELWVRPPRPDYERGWSAVKMVWHQEVYNGVEKGLLSQRLKQLFERTKSLREKHVHESQDAAAIKRNGGGHLGTQQELDSFSGQTSTLAKGEA